MHLLKIQLEGYTRFALAGIQFFTWTPTSPYAMILGSNGSGKSSLMDECSPLPADKDSYEVNGKKTVYYENEGHQYVVSSRRVTAAKMEHSFIRDGVSMNQGGTALVQKQLVEQFFNGYTEETHDILTGRTGFTRMSVGDRRRHLTRMSQEDYHYALALHDRLKTASRDLQGHLKHLRQRLHDETLAMKEGPAIEVLEPQVKALQVEITALLYARFPSTDRAATWQARCQADQKALENAATALLEAGKVVDATLAERSSQSLQRALDAQSIALQAVDQSLERYRVEYSDTETIQRALDSAQVDDMAALEKRLQEQRQTAMELETGIVIFPALKEAADPDTLFAVTQEILHPLMEVFSHLPDNSDRWVSRERLQSVLDQRRAQQIVLDKAEREEADLKAKIHAIVHSEKVTCPECKHQWVLGLDPKALPAHEVALKECQTTLASTKEALVAIDQSMEKMEAYLVQYRQWKGYVHQYPGLKVLWDHIVDNQFDTQHPEEHREVFYDWYRELEKACERHALHRRIAEQETLLRATPQGERKLLNERINKLTETIDSLTREKRQLQHERKRIASQFSAYVDYENAKTRYEEALKQWEHDYHEGLSALATEIMDADIARLQAQLGALQHGLQKQTQRMDRLTSLEADQAKAEKDLEALLLLVRELSPKEGEIAERMHAFMRGWVNSLNFTLRQVWSYDLEVLPCNFESGDLSYRFPVFLGGNNQTTPDVSETSTSIGQILDFAFRQTYVRYMGFKDIALFVDELDANLDDTHRVKLFPYLVRLMDGEHYSQLFMISHYQAGWSVFPEAEYVVIDDRNLVNKPPANPNLVIG
jgi:hypothetical protein